MGAVLLIHRDVVVVFRSSRPPYLFLLPPFFPPLSSSSRPLAFDFLTPLVFDVILVKPTPTFYVLPLLPFSSLRL